MTTLYIVSTSGGQQTLDAVGPSDLYPHNLGDGQYALTPYSAEALQITRDAPSGQTFLESSSELEVASIEVAPRLVSLIVGQTVQLVAKSYNSRHEVLGETYVWSGGNAVASVSASGLVTALTLGIVSIIATGDNSGETSAGEIRVMATPNWSSGRRKHK